MGERVYNLKNTHLKKLLIIGKTGTGKSTLCNRIAGKNFNDNLFPVSSSAKSCTQELNFATVQFGGHKERLVNVIDTLGFDDPENDTDVKIISTLVDRLVNNCDYVHQFVIAVS